MTHNPHDEPPRLHLVRDVLDSALKDRNEEPLGRADRIVIALHGDAPPQVVSIETGSSALAARLSPRLGRAAHRLGRRFGLRRGRPTRFRWSSVTSIGPDLHLDIDKSRSPASLWERWLLRHIIRRIPGMK
ncbi:MAG TPA: hypothetical protein VHQ47_18960 [Phycisphaerae bacterium]|nr:hypothetical protein [Phycisphaerae bacterium]